MWTALEGAAGGRGGKQVFARARGPEVSAAERRSIVGWGPSRPPIGWGTGFSLPVLNSSQDGVAAASCTSAGCRASGWPLEAPREGLAVSNLVNQGHSTVNSYSAQFILVYFSE